MVDNPENIYSYQIKPVLLDGSKNNLNKTGYESVLSVPFYEYVIITTTTLEPYFDDFVDWKRKKGFDIGVVTVNDIYSNYSGDLVSGIYDDAGKVRQYLSQSYAQGGTMFALLAGDYNTVPIRYGNTSNNEPGLEAAVPADLYFADFNGDWEVDGDEYYGEREEDNLDYYNEIYVSRLLCNNNDASNIYNWVKKVLIYEQSPGNGNYDYLTRNLLDQADAAQADNYTGGISSRYPPYFTNTIKEEIPSYDAADPSSPTGNEIITQINNNYYSLLSFSTHGGPRELYVLTYGYNGPRKSSVFSLSGYAIGTQPGSLNQLTNNDYPCILHSVGCEVMPFDDYLSGNSYNLGESFTVLGEYGGPSMIGNTRLGSGYTINLFYYFLYSQFPNPQLKSLATSDYSLNSSEIGYHFWKGKSNYVGQADFHYIILSTNLLGCPQTEYWRSTPQNFENIIITDTGNSIFVNTNGNSNCLISVTNINPSDDYQEVVFNETSYTFNTSIRPLQVTISKHYYRSENNKVDYLPYQAITGGNLTSNMTLSEDLIVVGDLTVNSGVTLTVNSGTELEFSNSASLIINGHLQVNGTGGSNVVFDFGSPNSGTQNGIIINNGGIASISYANISNAYNGIKIIPSSSQSTIQNCTLEDCYDGILVEYGSKDANLVISGNTIQDNTHYGISITNSGYGMNEEPTISGNTITGSSSHGLYLYNIENLATISGNTISNNTGSGIAMYYSSPHVTGNEVDDNYNGIGCGNASAPDMVILRIMIT